MSEVVFDEENWRTLQREATDLFKLHFAEVAYYQDIPLLVDHETYLKLDAACMMRVYTARIDGKLVGYSVYFLKHNLHYASSYQANQDIIFIHPKHRGFGNSFIKWCDKKLASLGVQVVHHHVKANEKLNFGPMLERQGYALIDLIYGKRLDRE